MKIKTLLFFSSLLLLIIPNLQAKDKAEAPSEEPTIESEPTQTPTPLPTATPTRSFKVQNPSKYLIVHKSKPSTAWGKVIQYHRDQILALSEKNRETIHEFVFQDDAGIVRTATYHETASGDGYWEVWVWDQP